MRWLLFRAPEKKEEFVRILASAILANEVIMCYDIG